MRLKHDQNFHKTSVCEVDHYVKPSQKPLVSSTSVQVAPEMLKAIAVLSVTTP